MHPSPLALEQLLAGQASADITSHLLTCDTCRTRLTEMEAAAKRFSASPRSLRAREAARKADRRWKQRAALLTLVPAAAVLALIIASLPRTTTAPTETLAQKQTVSPRLRQGREVLEPRPGTWPSRLRSLPIRGKNIEFGQGTLEAAIGDGPSRPFTLTHTRVDVAVTGFMQAVTVTQQFTNPFNAPVEAIYVFPLPDDAAVHDMTLHAGTRIIRAEIQKRAVARQQYEEAKAQGRRAALLDQERPNIFTQSLANLLPGESVEVTISYVAPLRYDDGVYTLNFPMVVGPRYVPGAVLPGESQGTGVTPDTDVVPDASRISPPTARSGRDVEVNVRIEAGTVIEDLWSVSHRLEVDRPASTQVNLGLHPLDTLPNKDLIVRWRVSGTQARAAVLAAGGQFALMLNPEAKEANLPPTAKEMVFVIDTSCSMNGPPLDAAKRAMSKAIEQMNADDTFMLIDFADKASSFHDVPLAATTDNVRRALGYLAQLPSGGGTNQLAGIRRALARPEDPRRVRMVLLMTDGFIGNEEEILEETRKLRGEARVFGFGIGSSVNHFLLSRLSDEGRGFYQYVRPDEDATEAVDRFVRRVRKPLVTNLTVDWGGLAVTDTVPDQVPDLFDAQPLIIQGRYRAEGRGTVVLRGRRAGQPVVFEVPVTLPALNTDGHALAMAWARARIEKLSRTQNNREPPEMVEQITALGLEFHLVTKYTSLVAVEKTPVTNTPAVTVAEPTLAPDETVQLEQKRFNTIQVIRGSSPGYTQGSVNGVDGLGTGLGMKGTGAGGGGIGTAVGHGRVGGELGTLGNYRSPTEKPPEAKPTNGDDDFAASFETGKRATRDPSPDPGLVTGTGKQAGGEDDSDSAFGGGATKAPPAPPAKNKTGGYIPPAPGSAGGVKTTLDQSDIMEVVLAHKQQLGVCVERQRRVNPSVSGKMILKWLVLLDGTTRQISVETPEFANTEVARCLMEAVRTWTFPRHTIEAAPVFFPFKF